MKRAGLLLHLTGMLMLILAAAMAPSLLLSVYDQGPDQRGLEISLAVTVVVGLLLAVGLRRRARQTNVDHREGFLIVGVGWIVAGIVGALPFYLYPHLAPEGICTQPWSASAALPVGRDFCAFTNALFESISGFTTTGATIITDGLWDDPETMLSNGRLGLPRGILLWRSMTHFLGGMGIIVLGVAILPLLGVGGMQLFKAEVPGPTAD